MRAFRTSFLIIALTFILTFLAILPARAEDETPPADATADTFALSRVMDLAPGIPDSYPDHITAYGNALFFSAYAENGIGRELWIFDPLAPLSPSNPVAYDVCLGIVSSFPRYLAVYDGALYFAADGCDGSGVELWKFTWANGAQRVLDLNPGSSSSEPDFLRANGNALYFRAISNNGLGIELWKYDASLPVSATNPQVFDICPGGVGSEPAYMTVYNGDMFFIANGCDGSGQELWKYSTITGAQLVLDLVPGIGGSFIGDLEVYDGSLFFKAYADEAGSELWMYNELEGAQLAADINPGSIGSFPAYLTVYNGALYFTADGGDNAGDELWKFDSVNGADRVADILSGPDSSAPGSMVVFNGALYFAADGGDGAGEELWKFDNTTTARYRPTKSYEGWLLESGENSNMGGTLNNNGTTFNLGDDAQNKQYRSILSFNTSNLPDNAVVVSATLKIRYQGLTGQNPFATHGNIVVDIIKGAFSGAPLLQTTDFQAAPGKAAAATIKNQPDINNWFTSILPLKAFPSINPTGTTQLRLRFAKDDNNDKGADFLSFHSANAPIFTDIPVLEVKYYIP